MCRIVLPGMKARKRGAIVNIGSGSATFLPSYPLYAVYGATKVRPGTSEAWCWVRCQNCKALKPHAAYGAARAEAMFGWLEGSTMASIRSSLGAIGFMLS